MELSYERDSMVISIRTLDAESLAVREDRESLVQAETEFLGDCADYKSGLQLGEAWPMQRRGPSPNGK